MDNKVPIGKSTIRVRTPNPLFEKWLLEWHNEESPTGSTETIYSKALQSMKKFPLVLVSGIECIILEHFDRNLCLKLNRRLEEHNESLKKGNSESPTEVQGDTNTECSNELVRKPQKRKKGGDGSSATQKGSPKRKTKPYIPAKRSAAYGLLVALVSQETQPGYPGFMTKEELLKKAQVHCDVSLKKPSSGSYYTGWSSMSQLITKALVQKTSNPAKFSLTEKGRELALSLKGSESGEGAPRPQDAASPRNDSGPVLSLALTSVPGSPTKTQEKKKKKKHVGESVGSNGSSSQSQEFETEEMIFLPSSFEVILLVDTAETAGSGNRDSDRLILALKSCEVRFEVRHLKVGDYVWIGRDALGREMVLPYIVERKRLDDLAASIKDGRYHEQKFRLKQCGLPNVIYLVEDSGLERNGLPLESIRQGISNTMCDKFSVKWTDNLQESAKYLARVTHILIQLFQNKTLFSCTKANLPEAYDFQDDIISLLSFQDFSLNMGKVKALSPREMFAKMLVQAHGVSPDKAWAITELYPTPRELIEGFLSGEAESLISQLAIGLHKRRVGPQIPATLKTFYTALQFPG